MQHKLQEGTRTNTPVNYACMRQYLKHILQPKLILIIFEEAHALVMRPATLLPDAVILPLTCARQQDE